MGVQNGFIQRPLLTMVGVPTIAMMPGGTCALVIVMRSLCLSHVPCVEVSLSLSRDLDPKQKQKLEILNSGRLDNSQCIESTLFDL